MITHNDSKKRVTDALNHRAGRVPFDLGATNVSTLHVSGIKQLRDYYGLSEEPVTLLNVASMTGAVAADLAEAMGIDTVGAFGPGMSYGIAREPRKRWTAPDGQELIVPEAFNVTPDGSGGWYVHPQGNITEPPSGHMPVGSPYFDNIEPNASVDDDHLNPEDNLEEYGVMDADALRYIANSVEQAKRTERAVVLTMPGLALGDISQVPGTGLKHPKGIRTIAEWYISPLIRPDYIKEVYDRQTDIALVNLKNVNDLCGDKVDVIFTCGTDFGHQSGQFYSRDTFRDIYLPYYRKVNDWIRTNTKWKVFKHTCGAIMPLIPDFIEAGFDILNPVQTSAADMNPVDLKHEYGDEVIFWGGGVDTQTTLPFGTPEEVRAQVLQRCEVLGKNGGFVFNTVHVIQKGIPLENIVAMIDAVHEFNGES